MKLPGKTFIAALMLVFGCSLPGRAQMIVNETFESYANTAQMDAHWSSSGLGELVSTNGNSGNSVWHPGGTVNQWIGSSFSISPTASQNIVLRGDIYDKGGSAIPRQTIGLRQAGGTSPIFEMGLYLDHPNQYFVRIFNFAGSNNWVGFPAVGRALGWHRFEATFTLTNVTITLDRGSDGIIDSTIISTGPAPTNPFGDLRFGGPSGLISAEQVAWYDNISLEVVPVPEPSSLGLVGLFGLLLISLKVRSCFLKLEDRFRVLWWRV